MKRCDMCDHGEVCTWQKDVEGQGCEHYCEHMILIPVDATNGDVMRILFPALAVISDETPMLVRFDPENANIFNANWWNSPYREDVKNEYSR